MPIFMLVMPIFTQPHQTWLFSRVFSPCFPFFPPEMIANSTWDEYSMRFFFWMFTFLVIWGVAGIVWVLVEIWVVLGALSYKTTRGIKLVVGKVIEWV